MSITLHTFVSKFDDIISELVDKYTQITNTNIPKKIFTKLKNYKTFNSIKININKIFINYSVEFHKELVIEFINILYNHFPNENLKNKLNIVFEFLKSKEVVWDYYAKIQCYELIQYKIDNNQNLINLHYDVELPIGHHVVDLFYWEFLTVCDNAFNEYYVEQVQEIKEPEEKININDFKKVKQPSSLKIKLFNHQLTSINNLEQFELNEGVVKRNFVLNSKVAVLADKPGAGKSLAVVGWLSRYKIINNISSKTEDKIKKYCIEFDVKYKNKN